MKTVLSIEGMSCMHCVRHVSEALKEVEGVESVSVDLEEKTATLEHDESVTLDCLKGAIEDVGYTVK